MKHSEEEHDWLGSGAYFWEADPDRAMEWARRKSQAAARDGDPSYVPAVVGAVISLDYCLDLANRHFADTVAEAYDGYVAHSIKNNTPLAENEPGGKDDEDRLKRKLDCAVINFLHKNIAELGYPPFDTVRAPFLEGKELFAGSAFRKKTHIQIAVRNHACIKGYFYPPGLAPEDIAKRQAKALP